MKERPKVRQKKVERNLCQEEESGLLLANPSQRSTSNEEKEMSLTVGSVVGIFKSSNDFVAHFL